MSFLNGNTNGPEINDGLNENRLVVFKDRAEMEAKKPFLQTGQRFEIERDGDGAFNQRTRCYLDEQGEVVVEESADVVTTEQLFEYGGKPRFSVEVWPGKADSIPAGYVQSSGQQLTDKAFPQMRVDVIATQLSCPEADWQADPYKRATHWSLGDGVSWMRPPDKNGVQPGNVGSFYGTGSNPEGAKTGTAVIDAMRNVVGEMTNINPIPGPTGVSGAFSSAPTGFSATNNAGIISGIYNYTFNAAKALPAGTTTDPITGEFRPRTWYGIYIIRMYGRVIPNGEVSVQGLLNQLDIANAKIATLAAQPKMPKGVTTTVTRVAGVQYTNDSTTDWMLVTAGFSATAVNGYGVITVSDTRTSQVIIPASGWSGPAAILVGPLQTYNIVLSNATISTVKETR